MSQADSYHGKGQLNVAPELVDSLLMEKISDDQARRDLARLREHIGQYGDAVVALSGGVDSAVVAAISYIALGDKAVAITGVGQAVSQAEISDCRRVLEQIGIKHSFIETREIDDPNYVRNDGNRCYYCKTNLYQTIADWARGNGYRTLLTGTNHDDLGDYRPGLKAAAEYGVRAPLAELGITKDRVRLIAHALKLQVADKPSSPCLASRIAYGQPVTPESLRRVESVEAFLHSLGFHDVRARVHGDQLLRLELHLRDWSKLLDRSLIEEVNRFAKEAGFLFVTMDLMGRQSGSLNRMLPILA